jgi:hypothetical protein
MDPWSLGVRGKFSENPDGAEANKISLYGGRYRVRPDRQSRDEFQRLGAWLRKSSFRELSSSHHTRGPPCCGRRRNNGRLLIRYSDNLQYMHGLCVAWRKTKTLHGQCRKRNLIAGGQWPVWPCCRLRDCHRKECVPLCVWQRKRVQTCTAGTLSTYHLTAAFAGYACVILFTVWH